MVKIVSQQKKWIDALMDMLECHLGSKSEIVLYDLENEYGDTIAEVRNGHITGSRVGRRGNAFAGLELNAGSSKKGDRYNYITYTRDAKVLRTSTTFLRDEDGKPVAALCIHTDITQTVKFESYLREFNGHEAGEADSKNTLANVRQILEDFLQQGLQLVGKPAAAMTRGDKMKMLKYLDDCGVFLISKSGERVCEFLGISNFTLYNYLEQVRSKEHS